MTTSKTKTYNRDAAILYAQKWANSFNPQYPTLKKSVLRIPIVLILSLSVYLQEGLQ